MSEMNDLNDSLMRRKDRKEQCVAFLRKAEGLALEYEKTVGTGGEGRNSAHLSRVFHDLAEKTEAAKLKILVAGQFKHGKSTLINAMLGQEVLAVASTPCTAVITEITFGETREAVLSFKNEIGPLPRQTPEKIARHIAGRTRDIPDFMVSSEDINDLNQYLVIPEDENRDPGQAVEENPYARCRLSWPLELCRNDVEFIDSPGLNEAAARDAATYEYVPQADLVVHVLNANQLFGQPDRDFVERLGKFGSIPLVFAINRYDQLNTEKDREKVRARAARELSPFTRYGEDGIFFLSAYRALAGRLNEDAEAFAASGFQDFESGIARIVEADRGAIKLRDNIQGAQNALAALLENDLPELRRKLDANVEELEKKYSENEKEFARLEARRRQIDKKLNSGLAAINREAVDRLKKFFLNFARYGVEKSVRDTEIYIELLSPKRSCRRAVDLLTQTMLAGLEREFAYFYKDFEATLNDDLLKLEVDIEDELANFNDILNSIRLDLDMGRQGPALSFGGDYDPGLLDMVQAMVTGGAVGGGGAMLLLGGAEFLGLRIFAMWLGPYGWLFTIATTIAGVLFSMMGNSDAEEKVRKQFITEAQDKLNSEAGKLANDLGERLKANLDNLRKTLMEVLDNKIDATRNPIVEAINMLKSNRENLEAKKKQLDDFNEEFQKLREAGDALSRQI